MSGIEDLLKTMIAKLHGIESRISRLEEWAQIHNETLAPLIGRLTAVEEGLDEVFAALPESGDDELIDALNRLSDNFDKRRPPTC